mmetsp:Transcript_11826/g.23301  ORF Transcript_11826/g.23301 Transcript_11826/m.23301 type:complete len:214 (-) Transcript_11826:624-1265(-)
MHSPSCILAIFNLSLTSCTPHSPSLKLASLRGHETKDAAQPLMDLGHLQPVPRILHPTLPQQHSDLLKPRPLAAPRLLLRILAEPFHTRSLRAPPHDARYSLRGLVHKGLPQGSHLPQDNGKRIHVASLVKVLPAVHLGGDIHEGTSVVVGLQEGRVLVPRKPKVAHLDLTGGRQQKVLRLHVPVHNRWRLCVQKRHTTRRPNTDFNASRQGG